jgi:hypothetical protein
MPACSQPVGELQLAERAAGGTWRLADAATADSTGKVSLTIPSSSATAAERTFRVQVAGTVNHSGFTSRTFAVDTQHGRKVARFTQKVTEQVGTWRPDTAQLALYLPSEVSVTPNPSFSYEVDYFAAPDAKVTFSLKRVLGVPVPKWASIDAATVVISGIPPVGDENDPGYLDVVVQVVDEAAHSSSQHIFISYDGH